jgi:hypothetical protein
VYSAWISVMNPRMMGRNPKSIWAGSAPPSDTVWAKRCSQ